MLGMQQGCQRQNGTANRFGKPDFQIGTSRRTLGPEQLLASFPRASTTILANECHAMARATADYGGLHALKFPAGGARTGRADRGGGRGPEWRGYGFDQRL
jgi:hypothetical protein